MFANFKPISKLLFISKIFKEIVHMQLKFYLDEHDILEVYQSGFAQYGDGFN